MSTGNVTTYHQDGGINFNDVKPDHVGSKVGTAETGDANRVYVINNTPQAKDVFGRGELVDALEQFSKNLTNQKVKNQCRFFVFVHSTIWLGV